jgi:hypothetical protein
VRTRAGVQALILILDNHEFFRQVGVALTTVIPRKRTGLIAAIVGWAVALALTGCSQLVAPGSQAPVIDSHAATSISLPQTDGQVPVSGASLSSPMLSGRAASQALFSSRGPRLRSASAARNLDETLQVGPIRSARGAMLRA